MYLAVQNLGCQAYTSSQEKACYCLEEPTTETVTTSLGQVAKTEEASAEVATSKTEENVF
jgi:hypothetical protein